MTKFDYCKTYVFSIIAIIGLILLDGFTLYPIKYVKSYHSLLSTSLSLISVILLYGVVIWLSYLLYHHIYSLYHNQIISIHTLPHFLHLHFHKSTWLLIFRTIIYIFIEMIICNAFNSAFYHQVGSSNQRILNKIASYSPATLIVMVISSIFLAPVVEELLYRGCLINLFKLKSKTMIMIAVIISSLIFSAMHVSTTIFSFLTYFIAGLLLAHCYLKTHTIKASITTHMVFNTFVWCLTLIPLLK